MTDAFKMTGLVAALCLAACNAPTRETGEAPPASPSPEPVVESRTIPAAFHGVWAATESDCDKPSETRLEITADHMRFYESSGVVASVEAQGDEILVVVPLSGEGSQSRRTFRYRLLDGGSRLFDVRNGLERIRCSTV